MLGVCARGKKEEREKKTWKVLVASLVDPIADYVHYLHEQPRPPSGNVMDPSTTGDARPLGTAGRMPRASVTGHESIS